MEKANTKHYIPFLKTPIINKKTANPNSSIGKRTLLGQK